MKATDRVIFAEQSLTIAMETADIKLHVHAAVEAIGLN